MMKPIKFDEANSLFVKEGAGDLPTYKDGYQIVSCWKMSFKDRVKALLFGKVWLCILGAKQPPVWLDCTKSVFEEK